MLNEQLIAYVRENTKAGFKRADIEAALKSSGWDALDIAAAFTATTGAPAPQPLNAPAAPPLSDQQSINTEVSRFRALNKQSSQKKIPDATEGGIIGFMLRNNLASSRQMANIMLIMCGVLCAGLAWWITFR